MSIELATLDRGVRGDGDPAPGPSIPPTPARSLNNSPDHSRQPSYDFPSRPPSAVTTTPKANYEYPSPAASAAASKAPSLHSRRPSEEEVGIAELDDGTAMTALPPVDGGKRAWVFLAAATFIEMTVWGLPFTVGVFHQYWQTRMFPDDESTLTLAATLQTALMYMSTALLGP